MMLQCAWELVGPPFMPPVPPRRRRPPRPRMEPHIQLQLMVLAPPDQPPRPKKVSKNINIKKLQILGNYPETQDGYPGWISRPLTRGDCADVPRPCPWVTCRHHLYLDVDVEEDSFKLSRPDLEPHEMEHSCSLDLAERGGMTLDEVGSAMNLKRERARQLEVMALAEMKAKLGG